MNQKNHALASYRKKQRAKMYRELVARAVVVCLLAAAPMAAYLLATS